jgi:hypothetical protein
MAPNESAKGFYFQREDYASFWVRLVVDILDLSVFVQCAWR